MFSCCDAGYVLHDYDPDSHTLDLTESAVALDSLFRLLHSPPKRFEAPPRKRDSDFTRVVETVPEATIPWPLLPSLFRLADKYNLSERILQSLHSHLGAYASVFPLQVYGYAVGLGLDEIAAKTSKHLLHPPLMSYTPEELRVIPTAEAYQKLLLLHDYRIKKLTEMLLNEEIFPHGYGECPRHVQHTKALWQSRKEKILGRIEAGEPHAHARRQTYSSKCGTQRRTLRRRWRLFSQSCRIVRSAAGHVQQLLLC